MEMYAFIARVAYRNPGTAASGMFGQGSQAANDCFKPIL
jgi:hypothetical protein